MAAEEEVVIVAHLAGKTQFIRDAEAMGLSVRELGVAADETGLAMERSGRRGYFMNQAMFTARRLLYGATLAFVATGVAAVRMGFGFNSAMQTARVALKPFREDLGGVQNELNYLFNFTKYTPFQFKDVTVAFRQMYLGMRTAGISAQTVNVTLHSIVDALSATGRTSPGALNRVAVALQHMAYQGHLTGYSVNQLARDGIPIFAALRKELHLTGDQIHQIDTLGVPTKVALDAINRFIETYPGTANAAYRIATQSLHGQFTTFKDNISMLMGNMETGVFQHFQKRLTAFNAFFGRIADQMQHKASFSAVIGDAFGGAAEFVWKQFAADLSLAWHIFSRFLVDLVRSKGLWATVTLALIILHGILVPIAYMFDHWGGALTVLIPLLIAWKTYTMAINALERIKIGLIALDEGETEALALKTIFYNNAVRAYLLVSRGYNAALGIGSVLMNGYVRGAGGQFRAMTNIEKIALRLRQGLISLFAPLVAIVTESAIWTAVLDANPIVLIVAGIVALTAGLVILYLKWAPFRNLINETFGWLWRHPLAASIIPIIGPLVAIAKLFSEIHRHLRGIYDLVRHPLRPFHGISHGSWWRRGLHIGGSILGIPGLASGGRTMTAGSIVVGERGAELMSVPAGATVQPLGTAGMLGGGQAPGGDSNRPIQIQFVVGRRVLEEVMVDIVNGRVSQA